MDFRFRGFFNRTVFADHKPEPVSFSADDPVDFIAEADAEFKSVFLFYELFKSIHFHT